MEKKKEKGNLKSHQILEQWLLGDLTTERGTALFSYGVGVLLFAVEVISRSFEVILRSFPSQQRLTR